MRRFSVIVAVCVCLLAGVGVPAASATPESVIGPWAHPYGKTYGQWSAAWWQWAYETPVNANGPKGRQNPLTLGSGPIDCSYGQSGPVWFLAGTAVSSVGGDGVPNYDANRTCSKPIPRGVTLMFPTINTEWDNMVCPPNQPTTNTVAQLRAIAAQAMETAHSMFATIDGQAVDDIAGPSTPYRVISPLFQWTAPADNIFSTSFACAPTRYPAGKVPAPGAVADGAYVMLEPLAPGVHVLHWGGAAKPFGNSFTQDITYTFRVGRDR